MRKTNTILRHVGRATALALGLTLFAAPAIAQQSQQQTERADQRESVGPTADGIMTGLDEPEHYRYDADGQQTQQQRQAQQRGQQIQTNTRNAGDQDAQRQRLQRSQQQGQQAQQNQRGQTFVEQDRQWGEIDESQMKRISGTVVDLETLLVHGRDAAVRAQGSAASLSESDPVALLADDGNVYVILDRAEQADQQRQQQAMGQTRDYQGQSQSRMTWQSDLERSQLFETQGQQEQPRALTGQSGQDQQAQKSYNLGQRDSAMEHADYGSREAGVTDVNAARADEISVDQANRGRQTRQMQQDAQRQPSQQARYGQQDRSIDRDRSGFGAATTDKDHLTDHTPRANRRFAPNFNTVDAREAALASERMSQDDQQPRALTGETGQKQGQHAQQGQQAQWDRNQRSQQAATGQQTQRDQQRNQTGQQGQYGQQGQAQRQDASNRGLQQGQIQPTDLKAGQKATLFGKVYEYEQLRGIAVEAYRVTESEPFAEGQRNADQTALRND